MNKLVVYTCVTANYDIVKKPYKSQDADFVCFSSDPLYEAPGWEMRLIKPFRNDPHLTSRLPKILPHEYLGDWEQSLWVDANIDVIGDVNRFLHKYSGTEGITVYLHPEGRNCVYEEFDAITRLNKDSIEHVERQKAHYRKAGLPERQGLNACGVILRRHLDPKVIQFNRLWWDKLVQFGKRDQVGFRYALWATCMDIKTIDENIRKNEYFVWRPHISKVVDRYKELEMAYHKQINKSKALQRKVDKLQLEIESLRSSMGKKFFEA